MELQKKAEILGEKTFLKLSCPNCGADTFGMRVLKDDGLATVQCLRCNRDYLLLDSEDLWFDVIQAGYPRPTRCSCKGTAFQLRCDYAYRDDGDVREIDVWTTCLECGKSKRVLNVDIDYGDTDELVTRPLRYCKNPKILYDLIRISLYLTRADMAAIVDYLQFELRCGFVSWLREEDAWVKSSLTGHRLKDVVLTDNGPMRGDRYLRIYALPRPVAVIDTEVDTLKKEDSFWKQREIIRISSPTRMGLGANQGLLYYIDFANEHVVDEKIIQKSPEFRRATSTLLHWLKETFVSWRGPLCFDNPAENLRLFGDRFAKGKKA